MRPINVSLDAYTWELAKRKHNFSKWVRDELRDESKRTDRLHTAEDDALFWAEQCKKLGDIIKELKGE